MTTITPLNLAVLVSGRGSNCRAIHHAIERGTLAARIRCILVSNDTSPIITFANDHDIPTGRVPAEPADFLATLALHGVDMIALAGYLKLIPADVVRAFRNRIVNIHPALLPAFGGKGMYGHHVHEAVLAAGAATSGATVHIVDEEYDRGPIVMQREVPVEAGDTPDTLAARVLAVEHVIYAEALQLFAEHRVTFPPPHNPEARP